MAGLMWTGGLLGTVRTGQQTHIEGTVEFLRRSTFRRRTYRGAKPSSKNAEAKVYTVLTAFSGT